MPESARIFAAAVLFAGTLHAQGLPAAQPTSAQGPASTPNGPSVLSSFRAQITWQQGVLKVDAVNSSLNGILRDIALRTGMKIVGVVSEESVFGSYGPDTADVVIQQLLTGTKTNMMLQMDGAGLPVLLTLTPLSGGVTPPNPAQMRPGPESMQPPSRAPQPGAQNPPPPPPPQNDVPPARHENALPQSGSQSSSPGDSPDSSQTDSNSSDSSGMQKTSDGAKTPQQIFEELQKLHQNQHE